MDDLYNNLENYHDEKIIDELKNENKDLKIKLEEYSSAMVRLQNDFDKLNAEYKKLEMNYSSLLKTARAEIERKSDMIKSLNTEKDMLVIKALQCSGKNILTSRRYNFNDEHQASKRHGINSECVLKPQQKKELSLDKQNEGRNHKNNRTNSSRTHSEDTISSLENKSQFSDESSKMNNYHRNKMYKTKENYTKEMHADNGMQCSKSNGQNTFNKRKSMSRIDPIFSSDDDFETLNVNNIRKSPLRKDIGYYEKRGSRSKCYSPSKDLYKNKTNRFIDHDKYRYTDRYESGKNYNRYSPDKSKGDHYKERVSRLPSSDNYTCSRSRDRKTKYEREKYYDNDRRSPHHQDYVGKHKNRIALNEPSSKRQKIEICTTTEENIYDKEKEKFDFKDNFNKHKDLIELSSCQSPDYDNIDSTLPQHVVKEIKHTTTTPLEDPRVSSKKYAAKNNKEKTILSTLVSENVDIIPVNVSTWDIPNIKKFTIPEETMTQLPTVNSDDFVKEIYMDIDNSTVLNESLESGEIHSIHDKNCKSENTGKIYENMKDNTRKDQRESSSSLQINSNNSHKSVTKYKIPKMNIDSNSIRHDNIETTTKLIESSLPVEQEISDKVQTLHHQANEIAEKNDIEKSCSEVISEKSKFPINTLADDLELSDEANENRSLQKDKVVKKKSKKSICKIKTKPSLMDVNNKCQNLQSFEDKNKTNESKETSEVAMMKKTLQKEIPCDSTKAHKIKKTIAQSDTKCSKVKEQNKSLQDNLTGKEQKNTISIQTRNKFSDLFGDSSSLITPDDLGIMSLQVQLPLTDVFDNTQDAVDLNVEDVNTAQPDIKKANTIQTVDEICSGDKEDTAKICNDAIKIEISKDCNKNSTKNNTSVNDLYENTESDTLSDISKVVKTVIISTGVQPKYMSENVLLQNTKTTNNDKVIAKKCMINSLKALATSTPQKPVHEELSTVILNPNDSSKGSLETNMSCESNSLNHNSQEVPKEVDVPDVRIYVRRRKKITKKS